MMKGLQILAGDFASYNPVEKWHPKGYSPPPLKGIELLPEVMAVLGYLKEDPTTLTISRAGAEYEVLALGRNHLDAVQERVSRNDWLKIRNHLDSIGQSAAALRSSLETHSLAGLLLRRTGFQGLAPNFIPALDQLQSDVARALAVVPANNMGDAQTMLGRMATSNGLLVLGCQNILAACGKRAGAKAGGQLETFAKMVKRLALGGNNKAGGIPAALRSEIVVGRSASVNLKLEALWLVQADLERRGKGDSELGRQASQESDVLAEKEQKEKG